MCDFQRSVPTLLDKRIRKHHIKWPCRGLLCTCSGPCLANPDFTAEPIQSPRRDCSRALAFLRAKGSQFHIHLIPKAPIFFLLGWGLVGTWGLFESDLNLHLKLEIWGGKGLGSISLLCSGLKSSGVASQSLTPPSFKIAGGNHLSGVYRHESRLGRSTCRGVMRNLSSGETSLDLTLVKEGISQMRSQVHAAVGMCSFLLSPSWCGVAELDTEGIA